MIGSKYPSIPNHYHQSETKSHFKKKKNHPLNLNQISKTKIPANVPSHTLTKQIKSLSPTASNSRRPISKNQITNHHHRHLLVVVIHNQTVQHR